MTDTSTNPIKFSTVHLMMKIFFNRFKEVEGNPQKSKFQFLGALENKVFGAEEIIFPLVRKSKAFSKIRTNFLNHKIPKNL
jgi:hypothetical protein